jgi:hypothetical protein
MTEWPPDLVARAHLRGLILDLARRHVVVREDVLWTENPFVRQDVQALLERVEEEGEIERFMGSYRARTPRG